MPPNPPGAKAKTPQEWLLENDVGYTLQLVYSHQQEREGRQLPVCTDGNKDALTRYTQAFPEFVEALSFHKACDVARVRASLPGQEGQALVGLASTRERLQDLYIATDKERESAVSPQRPADPTDAELAQIVDDYENSVSVQSSARREGQGDPSPGEDRATPPGGGQGDPSRREDRATPARRGRTGRPQPRRGEDRGDPSPGEEDRERGGGGGAAAAPLQTLLPPGPPADSVEMCPTGWRATLSTAQQQWIGQVLFTWKNNRAEADCRGNLRKSGVYTKTIRRVLDIDSWYLMATEYLACSRCTKKVVA
ncbi:hypothetical protein DPEC_G00370350 [Dallia pectoralis]|nr:hypothetical protein DPEC_G00370350 [Dallia pectoralis]